MKTGLKYPYKRIEGDKSHASKPEILKRAHAELLRTDEVATQMGVSLYKRSVQIDERTLIITLKAGDIYSIYIYAAPLEEIISVEEPVIELREFVLERCPPAFCVYQRKYTGEQRLNWWRSYNIPVYIDYENGLSYQGYKLPHTDPVGKLLVYDYSKTPKPRWVLSDLDHIPDPYEDDGWAWQIFGSSAGYYDLPRETYHGGWWGLPEAEADLYGSYKKCDVLTWAGCPTSVGESYKQPKKLKYSPEYWGDAKEDIYDYSGNITQNKMRPWFCFEGRKIHVVSSIDALSETRGNVLGATIIPDKTEEIDYFYALTDGVYGYPSTPWEKPYGTNITIYRYPVSKAYNNINSTLWEEVGTINPSEKTIQARWTSTIVDAGRTAYVVAYSTRDSQYRYSILKIDIENCTYQTAYEEADRRITGPVSYSNATNYSTSPDVGPFGECSPQAPDGTCHGYINPGPAYARSESLSMTTPDKYLYDVFLGLDKLYIYTMETQLSASLSNSSRYHQYKAPVVTGSSNCTQCFYNKWNNASRSNSAYETDSGSYIGSLDTYISCWEGEFSKRVSRLKVAEAYVTRSYSKTYSANCKVVEGTIFWAEEIMGVQKTNYVQSLSLSGSGFKRSIVFHHPKIPNNWHYVESTVNDTNTSNEVQNRAYNGPNGTDLGGSNTISNGVPASHGPQPRPWLQNSTSGSWSAGKWLPVPVGDETVHLEWQNDTSNSYIGILSTFYVPEYPSGIVPDNALYAESLISPLVHYAVNGYSYDVIMEPVHNVRWNNNRRTITEVTGQWVWNYWRSTWAAHHPSYNPDMMYYPNNVAVHRPIDEVTGDDWSYMYWLPKLSTHDWPGPITTVEPYRIASSEPHVAAHTVSNPNDYKDFGVDEWKIGSFRCWNPGWTTAVGSPSIGNGLETLRAGDYHGFHDVVYHSNVLTMDEIKELTEESEDFLDGLGVL